MATLSSGKHRYFLQVDDNTFVTDLDGIETAIELLEEGFNEEAALNNNHQYR